MNHLHDNMKAAERLSAILRSFKERPGYNIANGKWKTCVRVPTYA